MIKFIYCYRDKDVKAFGIPRVESMDKVSFCTGLKRAIIKGMELDKINVFIGQELYYLGWFDDETGLISNAEPDLLLDMDECIAARVALENEKAKKQVKVENKEGV